MAQISLGRWLTTRWAHIITIQQCSIENQKGGIATDFVQQLFATMLPFSGNNPNIAMFGVPPNNFAIGYVHNDNFRHENLK